MPMTSVMTPLYTGRRISKKNLENRLIFEEVKAYKVLALKTLDISQGSIATHLRCGGIFNDSIIIKFLLILTVK